MSAISSQEDRTHLWIKDLDENSSVAGSYLVKEKRVATTRRGEPFMSLILADRTGEMEAKVWEEAEALSALFQPGDILEVKGRVGSYRGRTQLTVTGLKPHEGEVDPGTFMESAPRDADEMIASLRKMLREAKNEHLKALIDRFLGDRAFVSLFMESPAAKHFHHSYLGGLLEHTLSVCQLALGVAEHYPQLDQELLLTAAFLHDIGKIKELKWRLQIEYTDEGRLLGHVMLGASMLDKKLDDLKNFPRELAVRLKHLILSHHGEYEFGSPKRPKFLEAFALHMIDDLDAKMNGVARFMAKDQTEGSWTDFNRLLGRYFLKGEIPPLEETGDDHYREDEKQASLF